MRRDPSPVDHVAAPAVPASDAALVIMTGSPPARPRPILLIIAAVVAFVLGTGTTAVMLLGDTSGRGQTADPPDLTGVKPLFPEAPDPYPPLAMPQIPKGCGLPSDMIAELVPEAVEDKQNDAQQRALGLAGGCRYSSSTKWNNSWHNGHLFGGLTVSFQLWENYRKKSSPAGAISYISFRRADDRSWQEVTGLGDEALVRYNESSGAGEVIIRHDALMITVQYSGKMIPKGSTVIYRTEPLGEKPAVDGTLRAAQEVASTAGAKVGEVKIGTPPERRLPRSARETPARSSARPRFSAWRWTPPRSPSRSPPSTRTPVAAPASGTATTGWTSTRASCPTRSRTTEP